jgi:hypothetical protein
MAKKVEPKPTEKPTPMKINNINLDPKPEPNEVYGSRVRKEAVGLAGLISAD